MSQKRPRILLISSSGQVGWELQRTLAPLGGIVATGRNKDARLAVDLANPDSLVLAFNEVRPTLVVNAAAYTAVDKAESEPDVAEAVNAVAPGIIGELAARQGAAVIHYSTDYVFDGTSGHPYREDDETSPAGVYGRSKLQGEQALLDVATDVLIFRTAWVYGQHGQNFLRTMLRLFAERDELRIVDDQVGSPTWSRMIAEVTALIASQLKMEPARFGEKRGIYHLTAAGQTSWFGFAQAILKNSEFDCRLLPIPSRDYPTPAKRPAWSVLDNTKLNDAFGLALPDWWHSLQYCMAEV